MKIINWLDEHLEETLLAILLTGIAALVFGQVVARYAFNSPLSWSDELARYMLIWSTFISASYCVKKRISIKIDQFQNALPEDLIPWVKMVRHTIVFAFCIIMLPYAYDYMMQAIRNGSTSPALGIPMGYIQVAPLICMVLLSIRVIQAWCKEFMKSYRHMAQSLRNSLKEKREEEEK